VTAADLAALREWAEAHAPAGYVQAVQVLALLAAYDRLAAAQPQPEAAP
jgi:hypothetical protein